MNRCPNCNVDVYESEAKCPLCKTELGAPKKTVVSYPAYRDIVKQASPLWNVPMFVLFATTLVCFYINIFTYDDGDVIWSAIVAASLLYINAIIGVTKSNEKRIGSKILRNHILTSIFLFVIDLTTGLKFWSTNYAFPFLTVVTTIYLTILAIRSKNLFSEYFGYIMLVTLISLIPIPIYIFGLSDAPWGAFVAIISSSIIALGLYLFADKSFKQEIKKRFHR